jgi:hypothetical protein
LKRGALPCSNPKRCEVCELPNLDPYSIRVLEFFLRCDKANLWTVSEFNGLRRHMNRDAVRIEAEARGIELSEHFLDKFAECESVIRGHDAAMIAARTPEAPKRG